MSEVIFSVGDVFSTNSLSGALGQEKAEKYFIPPYQRGYKWSSDNKDSKVWLLMTDLLGAFEAKDEDYWLQYITLRKEKVNDQTMLEVVDGQQRLTTLTLLFAVVSHKLNDQDLFATEDKLEYAIRERVKEFLQEFVYKNIEKLLAYKDWYEFKEAYDHYDEQDIFYLFSAARRINDLLPDEELKAFAEYVRDKVKIIVNLVNGTVSAEKIFSNLNDNKVDLTATELVKGLLLTKAGREKARGSQDQNTSESSQLRFSMGSQWDEMSHWVGNDKIKALYFSELSDQMLGLLEILSYHHESGEKDEDLFNHFLSQIKGGNTTATKLWDELREIFYILKDWFEKKEVHNLIGFLKHSRISLTNEDLAEHLTDREKDLLQFLTDRALSSLPDDLSILEYRDNKVEITDLLLFISVFNYKSRYPFHEHLENVWSLEHIFPQNPDDMPSELREEDIKLLNELLPEGWQERLREQQAQLPNEDQAEEFVRKLDEKLKGSFAEITRQEKEKLSGLLRSAKLHSLGNMALLNRGDNSSNGNGMFDIKRHNIVERVSKGSYVPKHTYDVFSKLLDQEMSPDLRIWNEKDITAHQNYIEETIANLKDKLQHEQQENA